MCVKGRYLITFGYGKENLKESADYSENPSEL